MYTHRLLPGIIEYYLMSFVYNHLLLRVEDKNIWGYPSMHLSCFPTPSQTKGKKKQTKNRMNILRACQRLSTLVKSPSYAFYPSSACELDNRVRVADILLARNSHGGRQGDRSGKGVAGGHFGSFSSNSHSRDRKTRSLSPDGNRASGFRAVEAAEETERRAHMTVIADATEKVRPCIPRQVRVLHPFKHLRYQYTATW